MTIITHRERAAKMPQKTLEGSSPTQKENRQDRRHEEKFVCFQKLPIINVDNPLCLPTFYIDNPACLTNTLEA